MKHSSKNYLNGEELKHELREKKDYYKETRVKPLASLLLDSSLISQTNTENYEMKIIKCGQYIQVYNYTSIRSKTDKNKEKLKNKKIDVDSLFSNIENIKKNDKKYIELKNINRSKFSLQRLVKSNIDEWKTFLTLTFEENLTDIEKANSYFNIWRTYIKKLKSDFKYICVPEFQKRGAVHYHLLTNINYTDFCLLCKEEKELFNPHTKRWHVGRAVVGWSYGYSMAKELNEDFNVVGYISKYMTKDIDNRLFGKRRYLYSLNLDKPEEIYIKDSDFIKMIIDSSNLIQTYNKTYFDEFENPIDFAEYFITSYNI